MTEKAALVQEGLRALIESESARRLQDIDPCDYMVDVLPRINRHPAA